MLPNFTRLTLLALGCLLLAACNRDPGPLAGTWKAAGIVPLTTTFRSGETESLGFIEKVSYEKQGNSVIVTVEDGMAKGMKMRYVIIDPNTIQGAGTTFRRVR